MSANTSVRAGDALAAHYIANDLAADGGHRAHRWTFLTLGRLRVRLRNFEWRRRAIVRHDLHHLITGYPCTVIGEFEMAAWEFAAGRFPSAAATLFCLPLVGFGAIAAPRRSFAAFVRGRQSTTLYRLARPDALDLPLSELRRLVLPATKRETSIKDRASYAALVFKSLMMMMIAPLILGAALVSTR